MPPATISSYMPIPKGVSSRPPTRCASSTTGISALAGDGVIRLAHPEDVSDLTPEQVAECHESGAEWFMDYRNADGSLAQMCGNGTRAITLFAYDRGYASGEAFRLGTRAGVKILTSLGDDERLGHNVFRVEMGAWKRGELDAFDVTIPGTPGFARGTYVDMGNPHVVAVLEDGKATLPAVEDLDLVTKPVVAPCWNPIRTWNSCASIRWTPKPAKARRPCASTNVDAAKRCPAARACAPRRSRLRAKTGIDHWMITVRGACCALT